MNRFFSGENEKIIVIDDDLTIHEIFSEILTSPGIKCTPFFACSELEALEIIKRELITENPVACGFVDIRLEKEKDGLELIKKIRELDGRFLTTIITAYDEEFYFKEFNSIFENKNFEEWDYLSKPLSTLQILQKTGFMLATWNRKNREEFFLKELLYNQKLIVIGSLTSGLAHDINNPLSLLHGDIPFLQSTLMQLISLIKLYEKKASPKELFEYKKEIYYDYLEKDVKESQENILFARNKLEKILRNIETFSVKEEELATIDVNKLLEQSVEILKFKNQKDIKILLQLKPLPILKVFPNLLSLAFIGIINNAIEAINKKGVITISSQVSEDSVLIKISDNGIGIDQENLKEIFNPFFTTKNGTNNMGLGLTLSKNIIEVHGGRLEAASTPNTLTLFSVYLPRKNLTS